MSLTYLLSPRFSPDYFYSLMRGDWGEGDAKLKSTT